MVFFARAVLYLYSQLGSAVQAAEGGTAVVIANGTRGEDVILSVVQGRPVGTLVTHNGHSELAIPVDQLADEGTCIYCPHTVQHNDTCTLSTH